MVGSFRERTFTVLGGIIVAKEFPFRSMRDWLEYLDDHNDLVRVDTEVSTVEDIAAFDYHSVRTPGNPCFLFENVKGYPGWRIASNVHYGRRRQAAILGIDDVSHLAREVGLRLDKRVSPMEVSTGPCKEVKIFGDDIDLTRIPFCIGGEYEGTPNLTAGLSNKMDPDTGWQNIAIRREGIAGPRTFSEQLVQAQQDFQIWAKYQMRGEKMPVAYAIGVDPLSYMISQTKMPPGVCEYDLWGAFTGQPLEVVKCETSDLLVPAQAEIVIEAEIDPLAEELDGPFPEFAGYYVPLTWTARAEVKCITMRRDPIFYYMAMGLAPNEGLDMAIPMQAGTLYNVLSKQLPGIINVHEQAHAIYIVQVQKAISKTIPQFAQLVGQAVKVAIPYACATLVVDDDFGEDLENYFELVNYMYNHFVATKDLVVIPGALGSTCNAAEFYAGGIGRYDYYVMDLTEKMPPWDEGYKRGKAIPGKGALARVEKELWPAVFGSALK
ncbi:MAG: UbiD family decarboxylase [Clostridia bacterium]|nr:MAG: UbiD family decarboxylase [Clostridia bacterium]